MTDAVGDLEIVGEIRGVGMMLAVELVSDRGTRAPLPMDAAPQDVIRRETGVIVRECAHTIVVSPPLVITESEALDVVGAIAQTLRRTDRQGHIAAA